MKRLVRLINNYFIKIILFVFYFVVIGLGAMIYRLFRKKFQGNSYWEDVSQRQLDVDYFKSAY